METLPEQLSQRNFLSPEEFVAVLRKREASHNSVDYVPEMGLKYIGKDVYYLVRVDKSYRREYLRND